MIEPIVSDKLGYENSDYVIVFNYSKDGVIVVIKNLTNNPIKIFWEESAYISPSGTAGRIIHNGIKLLDRNQPQAPTVIPPGALITDYIVPSDNIYFSDDRYTGGWKYLPILTQYRVGSVVGLFLPMEVNGQKINMNYRFRIESIQ
jgi:hypothetical protein